MLEDGSDDVANRAASDVEIHPVVQKATELNTRSQYTAAVELLDDFLQREPANVEALVERGISLLFLRRFPQAHRNLAKAIEVGKVDRRRNASHISEAFARLVGLHHEAMSKIFARHPGDPSLYVSEECRHHFAAVLTCVALSLVYDDKNDVARLVSDSSVAQLAQLHGYNLNELAKFFAAARHVTPFLKIAPHVVPEQIREPFFAEAVPPCPADLSE